MEVHASNEINYFTLIPRELLFMIGERVAEVSDQILAWKIPKSSFPFVCTTFLDVYKEIRITILFNRILQLQGAQCIINLAENWSTLAKQEQYLYLYRELNNSHSIRSNLRYKEQIIHTRMQTLLLSIFNDNFENLFAQFASLIEAGAHVNARAMHRTPLLQLCNYVANFILGQDLIEMVHQKVSFRALQLLDYLLSAGANPNLGESTTPLLALLDTEPRSGEDIALLKSVVLKLLEAGADPKYAPPSSNWLFRNLSPIERARNKMPVLLSILQAEERAITVAHVQ